MALMVSLYLLQMNYRELIKESKVCLKNNPQYVSEILSTKIFLSGAKWMHEKLNQISNKETYFDDTINFSLYGLLKYGICLIVLLFVSILFYRINFFLTPLSLLVFYFCEVHFLFLFPLLIDNVKNPVWVSIKQTYIVGLFRSILTVFPIGLYMIAGLLNINAPFRNWHIGSMAILIWYQNEVRYRIR